MVVLALLTLFAIVGISFVLFANSTAQSAANNRASETEINPDMEPELCLSLFLGQMIYDVHDDILGVQSALRGHSFANMYGATSRRPAVQAGQLAGTRNTTIPGDNSLPYSGIGRYHTSPTRTSGADEFNLVNYQYFAADASSTTPSTWDRTSRSAPSGSNPYVPGNAPYTYCDANSMFLAYMDTATGQIKVPSFHRPGWASARSPRAIRTGLTPSCTDA